MIGAIAQALHADGGKIHLGRDPELGYARCFMVEDVREALGKGARESDVRVGGHDRYDAVGLR